MWEREGHGMPMLLNEIPMSLREIETAHRMN